MRCSQWVGNTVTQCGLPSKHNGQHLATRRDNPKSWDRQKASLRMQFHREGGTTAHDKARNRALAALSRKYPKDFTVLMAVALEQAQAQEESSWHKM